MAQTNYSKISRSGLTYPDKVVIITGGSKGIGEGCARTFVDAASKVVICARGVEEGQALAKELTAKGPGTCDFIRCDVSKPQEIKNVIEKTIERYKRLDCMVNNAGWHPPDHTIDEFSIEDFTNLLQLNLVSIFAGCKYALPYLRKTRGSIINMSSLVGHMGQQNAATYVATKGGITALTKALAVDEARYGVRVNAVSPAAVITPLAEQVAEQSNDPEKYFAWIASWHWLNRSATIGEIGSVCLFLATDAASFITGIELPVSGGAELAYGIKASSSV